MMPDLPEKLYNAKWLIFGVALFLLLLWIMQRFLDVFVYAIFLYYITRPIKQWVGKFIKNEGLQVIVSMLLLVLPIILIVAYTLLVGLGQLTALMGNQGIGGVISSGPLANLTTTFSGLQNSTTGSFDFTNLTSQDWFNAFSGYGNALPSVRDILIATGSTIADVLFKMFITFFLVFAMLSGDRRIKAWFEKVFPGMIAEHNRLFARYMDGVDKDLEKIFFSNLISIVFFAVIAAVSYVVLNLFAPASLQIPSPILLGLLTGVCALIPIVGMWIVVGPLTVYLLASSLLAGTFFPNLGFFIFEFLFIFFVVTTLPGYIVGPYLARGRVNTSLLIFAYIIGPLVFGITGIFLGAIVLVLLTNYFRVVVPEFSRETKLGGTGEPGGPNG
jgi:predicted PurR-regulated permease PerM